MLYRVALPLVATLAFGAVPALAATANQRTLPATTANMGVYSPISDYEGTTPGIAANQATTPNLAGFQQAKVTLDQAIAAAEKLGGGKAVDAAFEAMGANSGYAVNVLADGKMKALWVDPQSGQAMPQARISTAELNRQSLDKADLSDLHNAKTSLPQAIAMAEQHSGGKAIDATIVKHSNKLAYDIRVLRDGKLSTVWVDPVSGNISA